MLLDCAKNPALQSILQESSLNVPESSGLSWAARMKSIKPFPRLPGIDLLQELCREGNQKGWSIYLWGSAPGVAEEAKERLSRNYPNLKIVGASHGYLKGSEENEALETIKRLKPHLLFVGMGSPRQEEWIQKHSSFFPGIGVMGVGGSFDVISGRLPRAPKLFQALGIEWLYRWAREPWRTLRMLRLPLFLIKAVLHPDPSSKTD